MALDNIRTNIIDEAAKDYQEILDYATQQAKKQKEQELTKIEESVNESLNKILEEETIIEVGEDGSVQIKMSETEDATKDVTEEVAHTKEEESLEDIEEIYVSEDEDEIYVYEENNTNKDKTDMSMQTEEEAAKAAPAPAPTPEPTPEPAPAPEAEAAPVEEEETLETKVGELTDKIDTLISVLMQQNQAATTGKSAGEEEIEVIDDEAPAPAPAGAPEEVAPMEEEEMVFEIELEEEDENSHFDEMKNVLDGEEDELEETRGIGFASKRTGDKTKKMSTMQKHDGHHTPVTALDENKKIARYESKLDELSQENKGLISELKKLQLKEKEYEKSFVQLRKEFSNMQLHNAKLASVNKLFMEGGFSKKEKERVCEQFDSAGSYKEVENLFQKLIKENEIKVDREVSDRLRANTMNTVKPSNHKEPLFESEEMRRMKKLAGIIKEENE